MGRLQWSRVLGCETRNSHVRAAALPSRKIPSRQEAPNAQIRMVGSQEMSVIIGAREPCRNEDIERWHGPWWSSALGQFDSVNLPRAVNQYAFAWRQPRQCANEFVWKSVSDQDVDLDAMCCHVPIFLTTQKVTVRSTRGSSPARIRLVYRREKKGGAVLYENSVGPVHYLMAIQRVLPQQRSVEYQNQPKRHTRVVESARILGVYSRPV
jgi:hypothetical protein